LVAQPAEFIQAFEAADLLTESGLRFDEQTEDRRKDGKRQSYSSWGRITHNHLWD
jgi:hypothetical protein